MSNNTTSNYDVSTNSIGSNNITGWVLIIRFVFSRVPVNTPLPRSLLTESGERTVTITDNSI